MEQHDSAYTKNLKVRERSQGLFSFAQFNIEDFTMKNKICSKSVWYEPEECEICGKMTDVVHIVRVYHRHYATPTTGILRLTNMCQECFAKEHKSTSSHVSKNLHQRKERPINY